jgi:hypothetical protein
MQYIKGRNYECSKCKNKTLLKGYSRGLEEGDVEPFAYCLTEGCDEAYD